MLLTDNSFAEKIIEKYSSIESYYFDNDLLVFYRENPWRQAKTSAASYIELALKLLLAVQNYCQSGQRISLNWNMVNQVILKQTAAISAKTEKILSPVRKEINRLLLEKERIREQERTFRTNIDSQQISFRKNSTAQETLDFRKSSAKQRIVAFRKDSLGQYIRNFSEKKNQPENFIKEYEKWQILALGKEREKQQPENLIIEGIQQQISVFEREQERQQIIVSKEERIKPKLRFFREEKMGKQLQLFGEEKVRRQLQSFWKKRIRKQITDLEGEETEQHFLEQILLQETKIRKQSQKLDKKFRKELSLRESEKIIRKKVKLYSEVERQNKLRIRLEKQLQNLACWKMSDSQILKWLYIQSQNQLHSFFENQSDFQKMKSFDIQSAKLSSEPIYLENITSKLLKIAEHREIAQQLQTLINAQLEIQKFAVEKSRNLFYKSVELQIEKQMYGNSGYQALQTSARWLQRITSLFLTLSQKAENVYQWNFMKPVWDRQYIIWQPQSDDIIRNAIEALNLQIPSKRYSNTKKQKILTFNKMYLSQWLRDFTHEEGQIAWKSLSELKEISRRKNLLENVIKLNHASELNRLSTSKVLETSWDAMQELFQLLVLSPSITRMQKQLKRMFYNYESTIVQSIQQPKQVLLSSGFIKGHGFILYRQGKRNFSVQESEERIRTFIDLLEKPKVLAAVRKQMERVQKEEARKNGMTQQHSDHRIVTILSLEKQEKRQMISQVRQNFGIEAAKKLEQYLILKEHISGDATDQESQRQIDDLAKSMIDSYYKINWTKTFITAMGTDSENHLYNQIREKVHEPPEKSVKQLRSNLDLIMWLAQRKHRFGQEKINLAAKIQGYLQMKAITQFLQRRIVYKDNTFPNSLFYALGEQAKFNIPSYRSDIPTFHTIIPKSDSSQISVSRDDIRAANFENPQKWGEAQTEFFRKQKAHKNQMEETKRLITTLHKKVEIQEKLLTELKKGVQQGKVPEPININNLTRQVMRKMEDELRIEKMRRGLL